MGYNFPQQFRRGVLHFPREALKNANPKISISTIFCLLNTEKKDSKYSSISTGRWNFRCQEIQNKVEENKIKLCRVINQSEERKRKKEKAEEASREILGAIRKSSQGKAKQVKRGNDENLRSDERNKFSKQTDYLPMPFSSLTLFHSFLRIKICISPFNFPCLWGKGVNLRKKIGKVKKNFPRIPGLPRKRKTFPKNKKF